MAELGEYLKSPAGHVVPNVGGFSPNGWVRCDQFGNPVPEPPLATGAGGSPMLLVILLLFVFAVPIIVFLRYGPGVAEHQWNWRFSPTPAISNGVSTYSSNQIERYFNIPWNGGETLPLVGQKVVVTGDLKDANISAAGDINMLGTISGVGVVAKNGTINAINASHATLTAKKIVITGNAFNVKRLIVGINVGPFLPSRLDPPSKVNHER